jgi:hypothetical protein
MTVSRQICPGIRPSNENYDHVFLSFAWEFSLEFSVFNYGITFLMRGCLYFIVVAGPRQHSPSLASESLGSHDLTLLSQFLDSAKLMEKVLLLPAPKGRRGISRGQINAGRLW